MSTPEIASEKIAPLDEAGPRFEPFKNHATNLGGLAIHRALPARGRRMIGPWCFLDRFGPLSFDAGKPMDVGSHPHIGLQTVSWLLDGEIVHFDDLGNEALLRPGGVNVMTSGAAIAHAEQTPAQNSGRLNGVQLWTALPEAHRNDAASFQHVVETPTLVFPGGSIRVFSGTLDDCVSPAAHFSDIVGADLQIHAGETLELPLLTQREHGLLMLSGDAAFENQPFDENVLCYLGTNRSAASLRSRDGARLLLIGGAPFNETILMWWNFVARTPDEIRSAREDWQEQRRFGAVPGYRGPRIPAPQLMRLAPPNPMS